MVIDLEQQLAGHVFAFMLIFTRIGAGLMMFPGIGEAFVPQRTRAFFALAFTFLMLPILLPQVPVMPTQIGALTWLLVKEALVGIFFTSILRLIMGMIEVAGTIVAMQTGLSNAMILNPALASQSALTSALLSIAAIVLIFVTGLDHFLLRALMETYTIFPIGAPFPLGDVVQSFIQVVSKSFSVGVQMASPFIIVGLLLYLTMGTMQKMMPQVQLFLVLIPIQIWGGFFLFSTIISVMLLFWLQTYDEIVSSLFVS